ncbi:MAG: hypothetical protein AB7F43_02140 [Bacteriovoracia bacterium]
MSVSDSIIIIVSVLALLGSAMVSFSKSTLNVSMALFFELAALGVVYTYTGAEFIGVFLFFLGVVSAFLVIGFSNMMTNDFNDEEESSGLRLRAKQIALGLLGLTSSIGLGIIFFISPTFLSSHKLTYSEFPRVISDWSLLGQAFGGERSVILELLFVTGGFIAVGGLILLRRRSSDAD